MTSDAESKTNLPQPTPERNSSLVTRSSVPVGLKYSAYKPYLRRDFFYSCAYCTMSEAEAQAIRFTIDHYEPKSAREDLEDDYSNLMYACDECNMRKGNRCPPASARADGFRFFRPDIDAYEQHFEKNGIRLRHKTTVGEFTIDAIDLNRMSLRRLRDIRQRLTDCDRYVVAGVLALKNFHIDQLPSSIKNQAVNTIKRAAKIAEKMANEIDELLREHAKSSLDAEDHEFVERTKKRAKKLKGLAALYPDNWRADEHSRRQR